MQWIYLSPHFDDVAFSCGGLVWEQVQSGDDVSILTVCAGEPPAGPISPYAQSLHDRWETGPDAVSVRNAENMRSSQILGATTINLTIPDVVYRRSPLDDSPMCESDADLSAGLRPEELQLIDILRDDLKKNLPLNCEIVSPLALGGHVDHRLVRAAVEELGRSVWYYADFPYLIDLDETPPELEKELNHKLLPISEHGLEIWMASIAAHSSQISTFWAGTDQMREAVRTYWEPFQGLRIWYFT